jgi:hypothetical protein
MVDAKPVHEKVVAYLLLLPPTPIYVCRNGDDKGQDQTPRGDTANEVQTRQLSGKYGCRERCHLAQ